MIAFLRDLARRAKPYAEQDRAELEAFARDELGLDALQAWDISYASEKLRVARYAFSEHEVKQYFPEPKVLQGLFGVVGTLYGVRFAERRVATWHPDVRYFEIFQGDTLLGGFYLDLYARDGKRPARGWTTCAAAAARASRCRPRWPTWCATSAARWATSRPTSPTTR